MRPRYTKVRILAIVAASIVGGTIVLSVLGEALSQVGGAVGAVTSDSANELVNVFGLSTFVLGIAIAAGLFVWSNIEGQTPRRARPRSRRSQRRR